MTIARHIGFDPFGPAHAPLRGPPSVGRTPVYIVCSPLGRVGKTLVARLLIEFLHSDDRDVEAFDLDCSEPALIDYLPECTAVSDITTTRGQMALFDRLATDDGVAKIVDVGQASFESFFKVAAQVDFLPETKRLGIQVVALFLAASQPTCVRAYQVLRRWPAGMMLAPVHNEAALHLAHRDLFPPPVGSLPIRIPLLPLGVARVVAPPTFSFAALRRGALGIAALEFQPDIEAWFKRVWREFRELELRLLLAHLGFARTG